MKNKFRKCTEGELKDFVGSYLRPLEVDVYHAPDPPLLTYNDFTRGVWPESVVARTWLNQVHGEPNEHFILEGDET